MARTQLSNRPSRLFSSARLARQSASALLGVLLALPLFGAQIDGAEGGNDVLGKDGRTYKLVEGSFAQLIGVGTAGSDRPALGLQITESDGSKNLWIVPGTQNYVLGRSPGLIYQPGTDTIFLLWESQLGGIHSLLNLTAFRHDDGFTDVFQLSGNSYAAKLDPQFLVVRDHVGLTIEAGPTGVERTVIHLVWHEASGAVFYYPVWLIGGSFEWSYLRPLRLDTLFDSESDPASGERLLTLQPGADSRSVVVGMIDGVTRHLESIEIRVLPGALSELADAVRDSVSGHSGEIENVAADARAHVIHIGRRLNAGAVSVLANGAEDFLDDARGRISTSGHAQVAAEARAHVIHIGARLDRNGLIRAQDGSPSHMLHTTTVDAEGNTRSHDVELRRASARSLPEGLPMPTAALISPGGSDALLLWNEGDRVVYCESENGGWTDSSAIYLGANRSYADVLELLSGRHRLR